MREDLSIEKSTIQEKIQKYSDPIRHGEIQEFSQEERTELWRETWKIVHLNVEKTSEAISNNASHRTCSKGDRYIFKQSGFSWVFILNTLLVTKLGWQKCWGWCQDRRYVKTTGKALSCNMHPCFSQCWSARGFKVSNLQN